jgi:hypothetical protein
MVPAVQTPALSYEPEEVELHPLTSVRIDTEDRQMDLAFAIR